MDVGVRIWPQDDAFSEGGGGGGSGLLVDCGRRDFSLAISLVGEDDGEADAGDTVDADISSVVPSL